MTLVLLVAIAAVVVAVIVNRTSSAGSGAAATLPAAPANARGDERVCDHFATAAFDLPPDVGVLDYSTFDSDLQTIESLPTPKNASLANYDDQAGYLAVHGDNFSAAIEVTAGLTVCSHLFPEDKTVMAAYRSVQRQAIWVPGAITTLTTYNACVGATTLPICPYLGTTSGNG
jgi:hypothetical protein